MIIQNLLRTWICKSSRAALDLANENKKYCKFAKDIVSVKLENATSKRENSFEKRCQIVKYTNILQRLSSIERIPQETSDFGTLGAFGGLPRLEVLRLNDNEPGKIIITGINERLI